MIWKTEYFGLDFLAQSVAMLSVGLADPNIYKSQLVIRKYGQEHHREYKFGGMAKWRYRH